MLAPRVKSFLDEHHIKYSTLFHVAAYTAQETAQAAHIPGKNLAKTILFKKDGALAMAVLPADSKINFEQLRQAAHAKAIELAKEREFKDLFPECEVGAMPPFGNLYQMEVYVDKSLTSDEEIAFNAGSHTELLRLTFKDFSTLVHPKIAPFAM